MGSDKDEFSGVILGSAGLVLCALATLDPRLSRVEFAWRELAWAPVTISLCLVSLAMYARLRKLGGRGDLRPRAVGLDRGFGRLRARLPDDAWVAILECRCLFAAGRESEFRGALESVRAHDPGLAQHIELHSGARGLAAAGLATESTPRHRALAEARVAGFDLRVRRSRELCREILRRAPDDIEALIGFARSIGLDPYAGADELELALESAEFAVDRTGGRSPEAWIALGIVAVAAGDDPLALRSLESLDQIVADSDPLSPTAAYERDWLRSQLAPSAPAETEPAT
jgi:hypothetical protein